MKNRLLSIFALLALLTIGACSDDEPAAKTITDADGITITLTWLTDGTPAEALEDVDLDTDVYSDTDGDSGSSPDEFEEMTLTAANDDGEYLLTVNVFENYADKDVDYVVTISGGGKEYEYDGSFESDAAGADLIQEVATITKAGNKYTIKD